MGTQRSKANIPFLKKMATSIPSFDLGSIVDLKWKLGVSVASSEAATCEDPFVSVVLDLANADGKLTSHSFELSVPEFLNFCSAFQEMNELIQIV